MRVADYVALRCAEFGIRHTFLVTGGGAMHLNDAFARNKQLETVCFHHEQSAAIAAEAYCRTSGKLAVLNVTTGPGGINALNGVHGAYVDSIGMLVISGQVKRETLSLNYEVPLRQLGDQEVDIISMVKPIVKFASLVQKPEDIGLVMDKAFFLAQSGRPGPVWIDIPIDVQAQDIDENSLKRWDPKSLPELESDRDVSSNTIMELNLDSDSELDAKIKRLMAKLSVAKRPVMMVGTGVRISAMERSFLKLAERLNISVVTGWNAHDLLSSDHPYYAGRPGTVGDRAGNFTVQNADFLLVLGCRLNIRQISYNWDNFASKAWKAMVDIDLAELNKPTLNTDLKIHCDLQAFIPKMLTNLVEYTPPVEHKEYLQWCKTRVETYDVLDECLSEGSLINPYHFVDQLFHDLSEDAVVVAGNGSACVIGFQAATLKQGQRFFTNSGCASMGYDLPAAIGASFAKGCSSVVCLAGDGSLMMNIQELATVAGYKLPIKIIVLNNQGYHSIRQTQQAYFPDNVFGTSTENGVFFPDFVRVGQAFNIPSIQVTDLKSWQSDTVQEMLTNNQSVLIDVHVDPNQPFSPKLASQKLEDGTMRSPSLENMWPFLEEEELRNNMLT